MNEPAEALAQLSRLLGDESLRTAPVEDARVASRRGLARLAEGLVAEAAASDDVFDHDSALVYIDQRLIALSAVIDPPDASWLKAVARAHIDKW